jgi:Fe-Mn family superoxide dismutase
MMNIENKINLLTEKINTTDFLLLEMKKIGIEKLPYSQSSLKRFIDAKTMDVHYNGHYKTYVKKLNDALSKKNYGDLDLEEIIKSISKFPKSIRNNAGGAFNHALFWKMLSPDKKQIPSELKSKIIKDFGSINEFKNKFNEESKDRFGSGWCWLISTKNGKLKVMSTPNQDNPLMNVVDGGGFPILGLDLWEHAYYLKYQNKRDEYIKNFWDVVNWEFVDELYQLKKKKQTIKEEVTFKVKDLLLFLKEDQEQLFFDDEIEKDYLSMLCSKRTTKKWIADPFCRLLNVRKVLENDELKKSLNSSIETLSSFYNNNRPPSFQKIISISLSDENYGRTISFLNILSNYIKTELYNDDISVEDNTKKSEVRQKLSKITTEDLSNDELADLLSAVRELEYSKYEKSFEGDEFGIKQTKLTLPLSCDPDDFYTLFELLKNFKNNEKDFEEYIQKIKSCINSSLTSDTPPLKADVITKKPLYVIDEDGNKEIIFGEDSHFEVKKMDVEVDSYLSEFFSIFKQSSLKDVKKDFLDDYNKVITEIYNYVKQNGDGYLERIKSQIRGIIFDNYLIVPIENLHFYWSNKGQRGCDELRLSIRFRIKPDENNKIDTYTYTKGSDILVKNSKQVSDSFYRKYQKEIECP